MNRNQFKYSFTVALLFSCTIAWAGNLYHQTYIWKGVMNLESLQDFKLAMKKEVPILGIEFQNSNGAGGSAGAIIAAIEEQIDFNKLNTYARGQCASTCAIAFLMGEKRTLLPPANNVPTHLMLHAVFNRQSGEIDYGATDKYFKKIVLKSNGKWHLSLLEKIYEAKNRTGGLFILREPVATATSGKQQVFYCSGEEKKLNRLCEPIVGLKPQDLGISIE